VAVRDEARARRFQFDAGSAAFAEQLAGAVGHLVAAGEALAGQAAVAVGAGEALQDCCLHVTPPVVIILKAGRCRRQRGGVGGDVGSQGRRTRACVGRPSDRTVTGRRSQPGGDQPVTTPERKDSPRNGCR